VGYTNHRQKSMLENITLYMHKVFLPYVTLRYLTFFILNEKKFPKSVDIQAIF